MEELRKEIAEIKKQIGYLTKLVETSIQESKPCAESKTRAESIDLIMNTIKENPMLKNNPMLAGIIGPLEKILKGA